MSSTDRLDIQRLETDLRQAIAMTPSVAILSCLDDRFQNNLKYLEDSRCNVSVLKTTLQTQIEEDNDALIEFSLLNAEPTQTKDMRTLLEYLNKYMKDNQNTPTFEEVINFILQQNTKNPTTFVEVVFALKSSGFNPVVAVTNSKYKTLNKYCVDLVIKAKNNRIDPLIGREEEVKRIIEILAHYKKKNPLLVGEAGVGKCLGKGTEVRMFDGTLKKVEDIVVGDLVMGPDSKARLVTSLARGREEMFRVDQKYGMSYEVNKSHILSLKHWKQGIVNIEVRDWINKSKAFKKDAKGWKSGFELPFRETEIPPYMLGVWLGDGHSDGPTVTTMDNEIVNYLESYCSSQCINLNKMEPAGQAFNYSMTGENGTFRAKLNKYNLIKNKHIPDEFMRNSRQVRLEVLAGILDTDGHLNNRGDVFEITQKNETLACQIQELAQSLNLRSSIKEVRKVCTNSPTKSEGKYYRVLITGNIVEIPTKLPRKKAKCKGLSHSNSAISLTSLGEGDYYGFTLEGPDRLFLLKDGTVTHNTAIVEGLASAISQGKVPAALIGAKIFSTSIAALMAGTKFRGDVEEKMGELLAELRKHEEEMGVPTILFIDEIHQIIGAGTNSGNQDGSSIANIIKPQLASGELSLIGATTDKEYKRTIQKDDALNRRMQVVRIEQPSDKETIDIIRKGIAPVLTSYHGVKFSKAVIERAVTLSSKYITDKAQPDKSISVLDSVGARLRTTEKRENARISDVEALISTITGTPVSAFKQKVGAEEYIDIEGKLNQVVFGQEEAVKKIAEIYERSKAGLSEEGQPIGSVLAMGPTGTGKTLIATELARITDSNFFKINMAEYSEEHSVSKLFGAGPSYVGYQDGGHLTNQIRKNPHTILLLDEIEKAHKKVYDALLGIIDGGSMTDGEGNKVDFSNVFIIMTSNVGAAQAALTAKKTINLSGRTEIIQQAKASVTTEVLKSTFSPEFRNKLSLIVEFNPLGEDQIKQVTGKFLKQAQAKLKDRKGVDIEFTEEVHEYLRKNGFDSDMGARPIARLVNTKIVDVLIKPLLRGEIKSGDKLLFSVLDNDIVYTVNQGVNGNKEEVYQV